MQTSVLPLASLFLLGLSTGAPAVQVSDTKSQMIAPSPEIPSGPPATKLLPPLESIALPSEQAILNDFLMALSSAPTESEAGRAAEAALQRLKAPTKLRGFIQLLRAGALTEDGHPLDSIDAVEESVRLLPGYSAPLLAAVSVYAYANRPQRAADYLARAILIDPQSVRTFDEYEIAGLLRRLKAAGDVQRVRQISDDLLAIGWLGTTLGGRSQLAVSGIKRRVDEGDIAGARSLVTKLTVPQDSRSLLMVDEYRPIWADVEMWGGPKLEKQWRAYLRESHDRWSANKSAEVTRDYLKALLAAGHYRTAVRDVLPRFDHVDREADYDLIFAVSPMARALARVGRPADAEALYKRMEAIWPLGEHANALNITANYANFLLDQGRPEDALAKMDAAIADARRWGPEINNDALAAMHQSRLCMMHELGRDAKADLSVVMAMSAEQPVNIAMLQLCMNNAAAAKAALLTGLKSKKTRDGVVGFVQLSDGTESTTKYGQKMQARADALRGDPDLLREVAKYGRVLPWAANAAAPAEVL